MDITIVCLDVSCLIADHYALLDNLVGLILTHSTYLISESIVLAITVDPDVCLRSSVLIERLPYLHESMREHCLIVIEWLATEGIVPVLICHIADVSQF